jgi:hypothetical protein
MSSKTIAIKSATAEDFAPLIGQLFSVAESAGEGPLTELILIKAEPIGRGLAGFREPFHLIFEAADGRRLEQKIYWFKNDDVEEFMLFIVPVQLIPSKCQYQAIFN